MVNLFAPVLIILEIIWQAILKYPASIEQIYFGISNLPELWWIRFASLALILLSTYLFSKNIKNYKKYYWIIVASVPTLSFLWMSHPQDVIKIVSIMGVFFWATKKFKKPATWLTITSVFVISINLLVFKQSPEIVNIFSLKKPAEEVVLRFFAEDKFKNGVAIPLIIKRVAYNKYFFAVRDLSNEILHFFDFETLFFQDVHPLDQKAFPIFFWPELFLLFSSIWLISNKSIKLEKEVYGFLLIALIYFLTSTGSTERRLVLTVWPIAVLFAQTLGYLLKQKNKLLIIVTFATIALSAYGWGTNYYDRYKRPEYWLDNRPLVYKFAIANIADNLDSTDNFIVSDILYMANDYCLFYLDDCSKVSIENFDYPNNAGKKGNSIYIGFTGNFLGVSAVNNFSDNPREVINQSGFTVLSVYDVLNNIADSYGQKVFVAKTK